LEGRVSGLPIWANTGARGGGFQLSLVLQIVASDGEMVGSRTVTTGTHQNALMGIPPTGRPIRVPGVDMARLSGGLIAERWCGLDTFSLLQQLGVVGAPSSAPAASSAG
jgi:hypothetical protein